MGLGQNSLDGFEKRLRKLSELDGNYVAAYNNLRYLIERLQPYFREDADPKRPLTTLLLSEQRLEGLVTRIKCAELDSHIEKILARLARSDSFESAYEELDVYRRLKLGGLQPSFINEGRKTTPDISINVNGHKAWVEVTSINQEIEVSPAPELLSLQMELSMSGVLIWGKVKGPMSREDIDMLRADAEEVAALVNATKKFQFRESERWSVFAVNKGSEEDVPEQFRFGFLFAYDRKEPHTVDIMLRVMQKMGKGYAEGEAGFIIIYDRFMDNEELLRILDEEDDQICQYLEDHPELLGVAVILPPGHTADYVMTGDKTCDRKIFRSYLVQPENMPEMIVVWPNPKPSIDNESIVEAFVSFKK